MKFKLTFLSLILTISMSTFAQETQESRLLIGPKLGISQTKLLFSDYPDRGYYREPIRGIVVGASLNLQISDNWALESGLAFSRKGYTSKPLSDITKSASHIEIPLFIKWKIRTSFLDFLGDGSRLYGLFGAKYDLHLSARSKVSSGTSPLNIGSDEYDFITRSDINLLVGTGMEFLINNKPLDLQVILFGIGIKDIDPREEFTALNWINYRVTLTYYLFGS